MATYGWHFTNGNQLRDGSPLPPVGEWLQHEGIAIPCCAGLHASQKLLDALTYAPGPTLHRVMLRGDLVDDGDKMVARERKVVWTLPAEVMEPILFEFARWCALEVVHMWDAPEVVVRYLKTGDEELREAAWEAAWAAAYDAARAAAWDAAYGAARAAPYDAAWAAAWDAARAAAYGAAYGAAYDAARDQQNKKLTGMVQRAHRRIHNG